MTDPVCFPVLPGEAHAQSWRRLDAILMLLSNSSQFRHTHGNAVMKQILFFIHSSGSRFSVLHQAIWEPFKPFWAVSTYSVAPVGPPVFLWSSSSWLRKGDQMQRKDLSSCKARGEIDPETQIKAVSTLNLSAPFLYQHWYKHLQNWLSAALLPALAVAGFLALLCCSAETCKWQHSCLSSDVSKYAQNSHVGSEFWIAIDWKLTWGRTEAEPNSPQQELTAKEDNPRQQRDHSSSRSPSHHLGNLLLKDWSAWVLLCAVMLYFSMGSSVSASSVVAELRV